MTHSDNNTITFTSSSSLNFSTKYTLNVASGLMSTQSESYAGGSWQFATLFDVGNTARSVIERYGSSDDLLYLGWVNHTRRLEAGSACAQFGFSAQPSMVFSCELRLVLSMLPAPII